MKIEPGKDIYSLNEQVRHELEDLIPVLSLCYRKLVQFYEIKYDLTPFNGEVRSAFCRRKLFSLPRRNEKRDVLIHVSGLFDGGFNRLLSAFRSHQGVEDLRRSIRFLSASYDALLDAGYFMAFSALECATNAYLGEKTRAFVPKKVWKKLEENLRKQVDETLSNLDTQKVEIVPEFNPTELADAIKGKLPELKRAPVVNRIMKACMRSSIPTDDLWRKLGVE